MRLINMFMPLLLASCCGAASTATSVTIVDENATVQTKALYDNLFKVREKGVMFGHQDATLYGTDWKFESDRSDVKSVCGDYPAVYGWEIGDIELGRSMSLDSIPFTMMREHIIAAYKRGGVNTISWHANNPVTGGNAWDNSVDNAVESVLPDGENHAKFNSWLDKVAEFFLSLKSDGGELVPILFRPWHEHTGSWFWWGEDLSSVDQYKKLWRYTVEYLRDTKGVHNLLYIYSPDRVGSGSKYMERYPGDEYIDVLGFDIYQKSFDIFSSVVPSRFAMLDSIATDHKKPYVFSETGYENVPDSTWWTKTLLKSIMNSKVSYVLVWRNAWNIPGHYFGPYPGAISQNDFVKFKEDALTLFESDLPNMYKMQETR